MNTSPIRLAVLAGSILFSIQAFASDIVAPGAKLEKLSADFLFTEGPTCDTQGNLFFTDQNNDRIMEWSVDGKLSTYMQPSGRANGMFFDARGNLIACADEKNELWSIAPDKKVTVLIKNFHGKYMNGPNDVWISPNGDMYITDPFYKRTYWDHQTKALESEDVYFLSADKKKFEAVTHDLVRPNGITGTPDGKKLYVSDLDAHLTYSYDIQPDGMLANKTLFCKLGSDGMTIDEQGNVYLSGNGVTVFDKTGKKIEHIDVHEPWVGNVCFAGKDHKTLFVTASKCLYSIQMNVKGGNPSK